MTTTTTNGNPRYALALTITAALGGLLFGYDTAVISGAVGFLRVHFQLDAAEMGWAASSALVGCVMGAAAAGEIGDRFGRKKALQVSALLYLVSGIWSAIPQSLTEFALARIVGGVGIGMASLISPLYIAEIAPARMRGRLVSYNQLAIVLGILGVYFVNYYIAGLGDETWDVSTGWRWMFASGALPALLFFLLLLRIPESPRFLVQAQRTGPALELLTRIAGAEQAKVDLRDIEAVVASKGDGHGRLWSGSARKPFVLGIALAVLQQITGINVFMYYAPEIFKQLGSATESALLQTVIVGACNVGFTFVAIRSIDRWGRRPLMIFGSAGMGISLVGLGVVAWMGTVQAWALIFVLGYIACFAMSLGPVVWVVLSEISPTRIRGRAMAVATLLLWTANYVVSQTFPIITENPWLVATFHHAFPFWLYAAFCVVTIVLVVTSVPETKGKTLEEIERYWVNRAKAQQPENV
jgi:MFS transporter, SP family, xylose:H+ symportor